MTKAVKKTLINYTQNLCKYLVKVSSYILQSTLCYGPISILLQNYCSVEGNKVKRNSRICTTVVYLSFEECNLCLCSNFECKSNFSLLTVAKLLVNLELE